MILFILNLNVLAWRISVRVVMWNHFGDGFECYDNVECLNEDEVCEDVILTQTPAKFRLLKFIKWNK